MARLTRVQKYSEYREKMANDAELQLMTEDLSRYHEELNKVKNLAANEAVQDMTKTSFQDDSTDSIYSALNDILNSIGDVDQVVKDEPVKEEVIDVTELLAPEKEAEMPAPVLETAEETASEETVEVREDAAEVVEETVEAEEDATQASEETIEAPAETVDEDVAEVVDVLGADEILSQIRNDESFISLEDSYRDSVNSIIDELLASNVIDDTAFVAPTDSIKEEPVLAEETVEDTVDLDINDILALDKEQEAEAVEEQPEAAVEETEANAEETEVEEVKLPLYTIPVVKKVSLSFEELNEYVDETVKDFELTIDSERIILGIPTPTVWVEEPVKAEEPAEVQKAEKESEEVVEESSTILFDIISDLEKEFTTKIDTITPEILLEETNAEAEPGAEVMEETAAETAAEVAEETAVEAVEETIAEETAVEEAELADSEEAAALAVVEEEPTEVVKETEEISEESAPLVLDAEEQLDDVIDDLVATNEINSSFVFDALKEADDFSAKEGLKTVEELQRSIIKEIAGSNSQTEEHPVAALEKEEVGGDTEVIEIRNFADLPQEERDAVLDDTIPFVIDRQKEKTQEIHIEDNEEDDDLISNKILNIILVVLIVVLLLVLGVVVYYILAAQGII